MIICRGARELRTGGVVERVAEISTILISTAVKRMLRKVALVEFGVEWSLSLVLTLAGPQSCWHGRGRIAHCLHFGINPSLVLF